MAGLLYKDFVSAFRYKKLNTVWIWVAITIIFMALRIIFSGESVAGSVSAIDGKGTEFVVVDLVLFFLQLFILIIVFKCVNSFTAKIVDNDEKSKVKSYIYSLPLGKNEYIASKYIFVGVATYVAMSFLIILNIIYTSYCGEGRMMEMGNMYVNVILGGAEMLIFMASIELPLFIIIGKEQAQFIKTNILNLITFIPLSIFLFYDLDKLAKYVDIFSISDWITKHITLVMLFEIISPIILLGLYYLSYRITCYIVAKKELM